MTCDMCGKEQVAAIAEVEGVRMTVCGSCMRFGKVIKHLTTAPPAKKQQSLRREETREEFVDTVRPDVARLLRQHRERLKLTPEQFAQRLGIRLSTYHHYESGAAVPDIPTARKLEHELKVPLVGKMKVQSPVLQRDDDARGLTLGDFMKRK